MTKKNQSISKPVLIGGGIVLVLILFIIASYSDLLGTRALKTGVRQSVLTGEQLTLSLPRATEPRKAVFCAETKKLLASTYTKCRTLKIIKATPTSFTVTSPGDVIGRAIIRIEYAKNSSRPFTPTGTNFALLVARAPIALDAVGGGDSGEGSGGGDSGGSSAASSSDGNDAVIPPDGTTTVASCPDSNGDGRTSLAELIAIRNNFGGG